jgi:microcystin-dependent protein
MDAFIGEVRAFGYQFAPEGWFECNGSLYSIQQYPALFAILGTSYGGDGRTTFGVPNLQGHAVVGVGQGPGLSNWTKGLSAGTEEVALTSSAQLPSHNHTLMMETVTTNVQASTTAAPVADKSWLSHPVQVVTATPGTTNPIFNLEKPVAPNTTLAATTIGPACTATPAGHENRQPFLTMIYCVCWNGTFPISG